MSKIFIIAGPSGVGKDTIVEAVLQKFPQLEKTVSYTDREKRLDDKPNSYHFISKEKFDELVEEGEIFEWEYARDERRYGASKKEITESLERGKNLIKVIGPKSISNLRKIFGNKIVSIFLKFQNLNLLKERIKKNRPDSSNEDIEIRYNQGLKDMEFEKYYDYSVVNPEGHPERAIEEVEKIIQKEIDGEKENRALLTPP